MKTIITRSFAIFVCLAVGACAARGSASPVDATHTAVPSLAPSPSPTSGTPQVPALVKTSVEFYRNGKTYEIILGYQVGDAYRHATPQPAFPDEKWVAAGANSAALERYGDLDGDGELEFIVSLIYIGAYGWESVQIYEYDPEKDAYYVADEFGAKYPAVDDYTDIDGDGTPELMTANYGFCYNCSTASVALAALAILRYEDGKFVDVTTEFPDLIQADADSFLKSAKANEQDAAFITLPGYFYDMYRLGKIEAARPIFDQVCADVVKPSLSSPDQNFDCAQFRIDVEKSAAEFRVGQ